LRAGEVLAVLGAAASTGVAAIQLGKALGATVIAIASSKEKLELCAGIGADHLVNWKTRDVGDQFRKITDGRGVDVLFDPVGGAVAAQPSRESADRLPGGAAATCVRGSVAIRRCWPLSHESSKGRLFGYYFCNKALKSVT
jgi:NADPH:quinone reductase-like Zn-dependent oxidoreductase